MPSKLISAAIAAIALTVTAAPASAHTLANWDKKQQSQVVKAGLMQKLPGGFHGEQPLTSGELTQAFTALSARTGTPAVNVSSAPISVTRFDALMVDQLGLNDAATTFQSQAADAGLQPPSYFGTEVVARLLSLRYNHLTPDDKLELYPWDGITRAEAAWSLAQTLSMGDWEAQNVRDIATRFQLPHYTAKQLAPLRVAVSKIGMPYVWGGETDGPSPGQVHGGYDCSGFAWRVYKLSGNPAGNKILGRTAAQQAGEIPKSKRIHLNRVQPGDLLFFGSAKFHSRATESNVIHEGIALSKDFAIHSSDQGVYVLPLYEGWLHDQFTWARRVL
ncbi:MAG TPA: NlpC/P60 family protein [Thermoleophilaceae bacterium]|nr:NlpC/P60 family protein [Thermoleophilaceae bacterium]